MSTTYQLNTETNLVEKITSEEVVVPIDVPVLIQEKTDNLAAKDRYNALIDGLDARNTEIDADIAQDSATRATSL